jgi:hypothetical protein
MLNNIPDKSQNISNFPFEESISSFFTIGNNLTDYFKGFLYSFTIYNEVPEAKVFKSEAALCGSSNITSCLSSCDISSYFDAERKECLPCLPECKLGCRNNISCTQCLDSYCKVCETFQSNCSECQPGYELKPEGCVACGEELYFDPRDKKCKPCALGTFIVNGKCIKCDSDEFLNEEIKKCLPCPKLCSACEGLNNCTRCIPKAFLKEDFLCYCEKGYDPQRKCSYIQTFFSARALVSSDNEITLEFSENLTSPLNKSSLNISLSSAAVDFSMTVESNDHYLLELDLPEEIKKGTKVKISISKPLKSVNNSLLTNYDIEVTLFPQKASAGATLIAQAKALAQQGVSSGLSAAMGTSALSFDPTSFFSFLSTAEMYYPLSLFSCDLPEDLSVFLASLRVQSMMPNIFAYGIDKDSGSEIPEKFKKLGFKSNLLLVNTGVNLTIGIIFLIIMALIKIMSYSQKLKPYVKKIRQMFEFGIFLKFWVQSFLEFMLGAILTLKFNTFSTSLEGFDFFVGMVIIVRNI